MRWLKDRLSDTELTATEWIVLTVLVLAFLAPFSCWRRKQDHRTPLHLWLHGKPHEMCLLQGALCEYERRRPNLRAVVTSIPGDETYLPKLLPAMQSGVAGDVLLLHWSMVSEVASKDALLPLDDRIEADQYDVDGLFEVSTMPYTFDGRLYAIPLRGSIMVLFYNKDLFDASSLAYPDDNWTRENFLAAAWPC